MQHFNLYDKYNPLVNYANYGKVSGLLLAYKHGLPVSTDGWVCTTPDDSLMQTQSFNRNYKMVCRPDAPLGKGNKLPRGRDLKFEDIPLFCEEIQKKCKEAIVLVFEHPSKKLSGKYIPRYQISGGIMAVIDKQENIDIEFVGPGFDVGDITRGKHVHTSLTIPIQETNEKLSYLFRMNKHNLIGRRYDISDEEYLISRRLRINELRTHLGEENCCDIDKYIPRTTPIFSLDIFQKVFQNCIEPLLYSEDIELGDSCGIMINLYETKLYVFEIWKPIRSSMEV